VPQRAVRRLLPFAAACAALLAAACGDNKVTNPDTGPSPLPAAQVRQISPPTLSTLLQSAPAFASCSPATTYSLTDGKRVAGTVSVSNDAQYLNVTYEITADDWYISDTRLAVAETYLKVPQDNKHNPEPWSFPYAGVHEPPVKTYTYLLPLSQVSQGAGDSIVVAAMAGVVHPKNGSDYEGPWEWMVMWGIGNIQGKSMETIHNYVVAACAGTPTPPPPAPSAGGIVTITFDDGWKETYTKVFPIMQELGLRGNSAVNPDAIDGEWGAYMNFTQVKALHAAGWSIVSHSLSHRDLTTLTASELDRELRDSKAWIEAKGFGPANVFVVPFHSWGQRERDVVMKYYKYARGYTVTQFYPERFAKVPITTPFDLTGFEPEYAPFTTADGRAMTMEYVKRAVREGEFVDIFFHHVTDAQLPAFRELMSQIAAYRANIRTYGELP
jgi:peptidoglycan/xylan/chitin deacetylase (PgdA/CDA1 family)